MGQSWIDKFIHKKIKLQKLIERNRRIMDNANFERDQKNFLKKKSRKRDTACRPKVRDGEIC